MEQGTIALATKLLVKAQSTNFDAEAAALTGRAYRLLADALNAYDDQTAAAGADRKRERRYLRDRRSMSPERVQTTPNRVPQPTAERSRRVSWIDQPSRRQIDIRV